jgi:AraC-like DNA-binding protein
MNYKMYAPPDALKPYVRYFWSLESSGMEPLLQNFRAMADGCPGLIFQQSGNGVFYQNDKLLSETFLYGQSTTFAELNLIGKFSTIGVYFHPSALKLLFGINAQLLTDSCIDIDAEACKQGFYLSEQLAEAVSVPEKIVLLSAWLISRAQSNAHHKDDAMAFALSSIMQTGGSIPLKNIYEKLQVSERTFERKFKEYVGISPKLFTRICRFQASLNQMRQSNFEKLSDIAFENEYSDQSHFIRSFREFTGFSPNQYKAQSYEVVENLSQLIK